MERKITAKKLLFSKDGSYELAPHSDFIMSCIYVMI
jgi:hypothetical protein